jgi:hypothetical protein
LNTFEKVRERPACLPACLPVCLSDGECRVDAGILLVTASRSSHRHDIFTSSSDWLFHCSDFASDADPCCTECARIAQNGKGGNER